MFADLLRSARKKAGVTQEELAQKAGVTREYISYLEHNKYIPSIVVFVRLARALDQSPADLITAFEKSLGRK